MGDAGESLIDAESRIQERQDELERERQSRRGRDTRDPQQVREAESMRLARTELTRQLAATVHERRRTVLTQAIEEIDRRIAQMTRPPSALS
jgi:hypothetical protein